jgi:hypothetical protein
MGDRDAWMKSMRRVRATDTVIDVVAVAATPN